MKTETTRSYVVGVDRDGAGNIQCAILSRTETLEIVAQLGPYRDADGRLLLTRYADDAPNPMFDSITICEEA